VSKNRSVGFVVGRIDQNGEIHARYCENSEGHSRAERTFGTIFRWNCWDQSLTATLRNMKGEHLTDQERSAIYNWLEENGYKEREES
jgi:hypothetical protein